MADYRQSQVSGTKWRRCCGIDVYNPFGKQGQVNFREQDLVLIDDKAVQIGTGNIATQVDMKKTFPLINPETGEATDKFVSHAEVYVILYSAYLAEAAERDAREAQVVPE